ALTLAAGTAVGSLLLGAPPLTSAIVEVTLPVLGTIKLVTALFFDLGVYLIVVGLVLDVLRSLGARLDLELPDLSSTSPRKTTATVAATVAAAAATGVIANGTGRRTEGAANGTGAEEKGTTDNGTPGNSTAEHGTTEKGTIENGTAGNSTTENGTANGRADNGVAGTDSDTEGAHR